MLATRLLFWWTSAQTTWPASLPARPEWPSYQEEPSVALIRGTLPGLPTRRRRSTVIVQPLSLTWILTAAQMATFETFYTDTLREGAKVFDGLAHPRTGVAGRWRFAGAPQYDWLGPNGWRVTTPLELVP